MLVGGERAADGARARDVVAADGPDAASPATRDAPSVDQAAAGQPQEHVLERAPPDQDGLGTSPRSWAATAAASPSSE